MSALVIDLETEKELREVGGKQNLHLLGVSVIGVYDYGGDKLYAYERHEFGELEVVLSATSLVIGFNIRHFDLPVLAPHVAMDVRKLAVLDLMDDVERHLGFRISLDNLSRATLGVGKIGMGLEAIEWWRQGLKEKVKEYCLQDVRLTRDLYEFGKQNGFVLGDTRDRGRVRIPVRWGANQTSIKKILRDAFDRRLVVEVDYLADDMKNRVKYKVDISVMYGDRFEGFCHTRQSRRTFQIDRVKSATITRESYQLENDVQRNLI